VGGEDTAHELPHGVGRWMMVASVSPPPTRPPRKTRAYPLNGSGPGWVGLSTKTGIDLQREANGQLSLASTTKSTRPVGKQRRFADGMRSGLVRGVIPVGLPLAAARVGQWTHLKIPLPALVARSGPWPCHDALCHSDFRTAGIECCQHPVESGMDGVTACPAP